MNLTGNQDDPPLVVPSRIGPPSSCEVPAWLAAAAEPAAQHSFAVGHEILVKFGCAISLGSGSGVHVRPPSIVEAMSPLVIEPFGVHKPPPDVAEL